MNDLLNYLFLLLKYLEICNR